MTSSQIQHRLTEYFRSAYGTDCDLLARAPGRVEFIGNHTDYNGGLVMGAAIDRSIFAAVRKRDDAALRFASEFSPERPERRLDDLSKFDGEQSWANYPLGVFATLLNEGLRTENGFDLALASDLPAGAGLSSSAALETGVGLALASLYGLEISKADLVRIGRAVENDFLGVPTGPLDQSCSGFGERNQLVFIDCRTLNVELVPFPAECRIHIFNSGISHALVDSLYSKRHDECREALRLLRQNQSDLEHLADAPESALDALPSDTPADVIKRARHVIRENQRVLTTRTALTEGDIERTGRLLIESHESSRTLFENSCPELDTLVEILAETPHVHGARLSGGGFGGTVIALTSEAFGADETRRVQDAYEKAHGRRLETLACNVADGAELLPTD